MRRLDEYDIPDWVNGTLLSPARTKPIVAVTSHQGSDRTWVDPDALQARLGDNAEVVFLETGDATWALAEELPPRLDCYGGALRVWWPGLTRDSDPFDHRLHLVRSAFDAERVVRTLVGDVTARSAGDRSPDATVEELPPEVVRITAISTDEITVATATRKGPLLDNDLPLAVLIDSATIDATFPARPVRRLADGRWEFTSRGLLPDAWHRFTAEVHVGDVIEGRVQNLNEGKNLVFVDLLPGVVGVCHRSQLDYSFVSRLEDFVQKGEIATWKVLEIDGERGGVQLSRKAAHGEPPRDLPSLLEGGRPFVWRPGQPWFQNLRRPTPRPVDAPRAEAEPRATPKRTTTSPSPAPPIDDRRDQLGEELTAANEDRQKLRERVRTLREENKELERRIAAAERSAQSEDPQASERAFLAGVRTAYARMFDEHDRFEHPLARMRVGREFLDTVRATPGIEIDKLLEVCAQVACDLAHSVPGRDVHPLRAGSRGADARFRKRDGAKAWRCALKQAPSAPRMHWWNVPSESGAVIEFACVGLHDHVDIPE